ncbi:hypothetical protein AWB80_06210 [Caballeronia pedi]|uniref:Uncharacterized protein n=1 Tax=Caballeronia pedi TaxID=1777141 RepID=A0A158D3J8_9BURK|nr:hypothetical protein [Caballeronia pedi]SAK88930.1 hypothetical protein AWB80_06210 [Caballeronia pedi]
MMVGLFGYNELSVLCSLRVSDTQANGLAEKKRRNPSFGAPEILAAIKRLKS